MERIKGVCAVHRRKEQTMQIVPKENKNPSKDLLKKTFKIHYFNVFKELQKIMTKNFKV